MKSERECSMSAKLYYTPPADIVFEEMRSAAMDVWSKYKDSPGDYYENKVSRVRDLKNVGDNFMYLFSMFDMHNQAFIVSRLSATARKDLRERMIDGGNDALYIRAVGL